MFEKEKNTPVHDRKYCDDSTTRVFHDEYDQKIRYAIAGRSDHIKSSS